MLTLNVLENDFRVFQSPTGSVEIKPTKESRAKAPKLTVIEDPEMIIKRPIWQTPFTRSDEFEVPVSRNIATELAVAQSYYTPTFSRSEQYSPTRTRNLLAKLELS